MIFKKNIILFSLLIIFIFLIYVDNSYAQNTTTQERSEDEDANWFLDKKISLFQYQGLKTISRSDMNNVLSDYIGKQFSYEILQDIQSILYELDLFQELIPEAKQGPNNELVLLFTFIEYPSASKIKFIGNRKIGISSLLGVIQLRRNEIVNDKKLKLDVKALKKYYYGQGYPKTEISYELIPDVTNSDQTVVTFYITENKKIYISSIQFIGNKFFSQKKLEEIISSRKKSIFFRGTYSEQQTANDKRLIEEKYGENGFIDAKVLDIIANTSSDSDDTAVELQFIIKEGSKFSLGTIDFSGNTIYASDELRKLFVIKENEVLDVSKIQRGYDRIRLKYSDEGFMFNQYNIQENRDTEENKVSYVIQINETGQSHVENIIIRGNIETKDFVIERELEFEEGELFTAKFVNNARNNLFNTRYFRTIIPETKPGSAPGLIDLILNLEEDRTRDIRFGMTFGGASQFPISLYFSWNQNNLFGRGLIWNNNINVSFNEQSIRSSFIEPRFLNTRFLLSTSLSFSHELVAQVPQDILGPYLDTDANTVNYDPYTGKYVFSVKKTHEGTKYNAGDPFKGTPTDDDIKKLGLVTDRQYFSSFINSVNNTSFMNYDIYQIGASLGSGYTHSTPIGDLGARLNVGPTFSYIYYDKFSYRPANIQTRRNLETWKIYNSIGISLFFDNRDIFFMPSQGFRVQQDFIFVGGILFGDSHYIKTNTSAETHFTLFDWQVAENWSWKMVLSTQTTFSTILPQWYYPDGKSFKTDGPTFNQRLRLNGITNARGWYRIYNGEATWNTWVELRMPLYETVIWWDQVFEVASLWTKLNDIYKPEETNYYFTLGSGFRFVLRQFPLRIYIAKRFLVQNNELKWQRGNLSSTGNQNDTGGLDLIFAISIFD